MMTSRVTRWACLLGLVLLPAQQLRAQQVFATPEQAAEQLVAAAKGGDKATALATIFGPDGPALLTSGDKDVDEARVLNFLDLAAASTAVADGEGKRKVLVFGQTGWRFPIPLKPSGAGWAFDIPAGRQEITDRTIGRNELVAISACADYVAAQQDYFAVLHDDEPVQRYAERLISTPGRHDGLWWPAASATDRSPLGDRIALPAETGGARPRGYHGYVFRILTRQGPSAPGGAYDYMVKGRLLAGFALLAYPAEWGKTGIMTFLCDQRGQVWQQNLGPRTARKAARIRSLDPDGWEPVPPMLAGATASR